MKWPWQHPKPSPLLAKEKAERVYTPAELEEITKLDQERNRISSETNFWPRPQDLVKIRLNGEIAQVVGVSYDRPKDYPTYYGLPVTDENKLEQARRYLEETKYGRQDMLLWYRYEVRLKSGLLVRELRQWEIEKVPTPESS